MKILKGFIFGKIVPNILLNSLQELSHDFILLDYGSSSYLQMSNINIGHQKIIEDVQVALVKGQQRVDPRNYFQK